jgi:uncharacterized membrane protein
VHDLLIVLAAFLACAVEMVEALTIVLAVGVTRGWRSALFGAGVAALALAVVVAVLGPALSQVPIDALRVFVGGLLLIFGLQWLRKAILRASGLKALHNEDLIYAHELEAARAAPEDHEGVDWYSFTVAFKGVFLEGLEVAFIVVSFGGSQGNLGLAAIGAAGAFVVVLAVGLVVHRPLSRVPENSMKFAVGVMLTSFGTFWGGEGLGVSWPGGDAALVAVVAFTAALGWVSVRMLRPSPARQAVV